MNRGIAMFFAFRPLTTILNWFLRDEDDDQNS